MQWAARGARVRVRRRRSERMLLLFRFYRWWQRSVRAPWPRSATEFDCVWCGYVRVMTAASPMHLQRSFPKIAKETGQSPASGFLKIAKETGPILDCVS